MIVRSITDLKDRKVFVEELRRRRAHHPAVASEPPPPARDSFAAVQRAQKLERAAPVVEVRR